MNQQFLVVSAAIDESISLTDDQEQRMQNALQDIAQTLEDAQAKVSVTFVYSDDTHTWTVVTYPSKGRFK